MLRTVCGEGMPPGFAMGILWGGEREGIGVFTVHMISNAHTLQARYSAVGCGSAGGQGHVIVRSWQRCCQ